MAVLCDHGDEPKMPRCAGYEKRRSNMHSVCRAEASITGGSFNLVPDQEENNL